MPKRIHEALNLTVESVDAPSGRQSIQLIDAGWGSSGYYSARVLENAANARVFPKGTHMYLDHPSQTEEHDRPERSVRDLAAVLVEDAVWNGTALVGEAKVFKAYRELLTDPDVAENIGLSIRAFADTTIGEAEGRKGTIITALTEALSIDYVTKAGRGGRILAVLESARTRVDEATSNDTREALNAALRAAYGAEDVWLWLRDFDDTTAWFTREDADSSAIYQQAYVLADNGTAVLADGDPTEVRARTEYVPVAATTEAEVVAPAKAALTEMLLACPLDRTHADGRAITRWVEVAANKALGIDLTEALYFNGDRNQRLSAVLPSTSVPAPAGQSTATESEGDDMATTQIEESRLAQLEKDSERVQSLESERDTLVRERDEAREALAAHDRHALITRTIDAVEGADSLTALERDGLAARVPAGDVDTAALTAAVEAAVAESAQRAGAGTITGFGATGTTTGGAITATESTASVMAAFGITQEG